MALFLEMEEVPFKPRAYRNVADAVVALDRPLALLYAERGLEAFDEIEGVGKGIARRIAELIEQGAIADLEVLRRKRPVDVFGLTAVEGIGPKMLKALYDHLGVTDVQGLAVAARTGTLRNVPRFGPKSEQRILRQLEYLSQTQGRLPIGDVLPVSRQIEDHLRSLPGVERLVAAGSQRRFVETVGDIDLLVASRNPEPIMERFATMPGVAEVYARGVRKTMLRLDVGIDADLLVVDPDCFGAALLYFTGSKQHNVRLRMIAQKRGLKLNEYGVFRGEERIAAHTEEEVYAALGLPFIPPELREDRGELEAAAAGELPELLEPGDIRGDLQVQTSWTDGRGSLEEMAEAARARGLEYLVITDHTRDLQGLDERRLMEQAAAIRALDARMTGIRVLAGAEVNIRRDGSLDVAESVLARLDVVGAGIHSAFDLPREEQTRRVVRAIENPHVHILFHPTARQLGKRAPLDLDMEAVIDAAVRTGTILEVDALPRRLDLSDRYVRRVMEAGGMIAVDSDAHRPEHFDCIRTYGVPVARRGWATKDRVLNALPAEEMLRRLTRAR